MSCLALSACAGIDYSKAPPVGWPELDIVVIAQNLKEVQVTCRNDFLPKVQIRACAQANFSSGICRIFTSNPDNIDLMEHEKAHCRGYDHPYESSIRDGFQSYQNMIRRIR